MPSHEIAARIKSSAHLAKDNFHDVVRGGDSTTDAVVDTKFVSLEGII
jgi:hypothetical protein